MLGGLDDTLDVVRQVAADTVAVTASPEITPALLKRIAWSLEGSGRRPDRCPGRHRRRGPTDLDPPRGGATPALRGRADLLWLHARSEAGYRPDWLWPWAAGAWHPDAGGRGLDPAHVAWPCPVPTVPRRARRPGLPCLQVPHHVRRRRRPQGRAPGRRTRPMVSLFKIADDPRITRARQDASAGFRSTSYPSSSTSSSETCPWWARARCRSTTPT